MIFAAYFILRGHDTHFLRLLLSRGVVVCGGHDLPFDARAFPLTSFEMQCSSSPLNKGFRLFNFLLSASWIRIIISEFVLVRECDGFFLLLTWLCVSHYQV